MVTKRGLLFVNVSFQRWIFHVEFGNVRGLVDESYEFGIIRKRDFYGSESEKLKG